MHIDGFRFDLATILGRSHKGEWITDPNLGLLSEIASDPVLRGCKLIAEAWDAAGLYKVGRFPMGWAEWNGMFRDDVRRFWRGDEDTVIGLARRISGSKDIFGEKQSAANSVNFITAHDGFTLRDCCSYLTKHNHRNGEQNRDGCDANLSDNFGVEGETDDPNTIRLRLKRAKNMMTTLILSRGVPMILGGDEIWRTQKGNNNGFCQDNETSWLNWNASPQGQEMLAFCQKLIALRKKYRALHQTAFGDPMLTNTHANLRFHGTQLTKPDWRTFSHSLAFEYLDGPKGPRFYVAMNAWTETLTFELPRRRWCSIIDTNQHYPMDFLMPPLPTHDLGKIDVAPDSVRVMLSYGH
jgi:glycogen operon protein